MNMDVDMRCELRERPAGVRISGGIGSRSWSFEVNASGSAAAPAYTSLGSTAFSVPSLRLERGEVRVAHIRSCVGRRDGTTRSPFLMIWPDPTAARPHTFCHMTHLK